MASLDRLFRPRAVAVIGASRHLQSVGGAILHNLIRNGFRGTIAPINPNAQSLQGWPCFPTIDAVPFAIDLAVIAVPQAAVPDVLEACGRKGVGAVVLITAGYRESGADGRAREDEVVAVTRRYGMRLVGPNCMGIMNMAPDVRLQASFSAHAPAAGSVAFASQSGALGEIMLALLGERGLGLSMFVSLGNKADVSSNDLLDAWADDPQTRVIVLYMESFGHPQKFLETAARVTRRMPVIAVKSGRSRVGARAASSHTGALAGSDRAVDALLRQSGVIRADTLEECFLYASALASPRQPSGSRVAFITNAGGPAILATDTAIAAGLQVPELSPATQTALRAQLPATASVANPVDMIASAQAPQYDLVMRAVLADSAVDAVVVMFTALQTNDPGAVADAIVSAAQGQSKPILVCMMGAAKEASVTARLRQADLPVFTFPEDAARAMAVMVRYHAERERPCSPPAPAVVGQWAAIEALCATVRAEPRTHLTLAEAQRVLEWAGIPVHPWREVATVDEVPTALAHLTLPLVAKVSASAIVHKSDIGGVRLGLRTAAEVTTAVRDLLVLARARDPRATVVLQQQATVGTELIVGASRDPGFGPFVMCGLGGVFVEVLNDVAFGVHPLRASDADAMLRSLKAFPVLDGARGRPKTDRQVLCDLLLRLDALMTACPAIAEIDINPFFAAPVGTLAAAADARVILGHDVSR